MADQVIEFVHVINSDEEKEGLAWFREVNSHLPIVTQPAVDGGSLDRGQLRDKGDIAEKLSYDNATLSKALSHIELWRHALEEQATITVAEDDAIFARDFVVTANAFLQGLPSNWDIVMWGWNFDAFLWVEMPEGVFCKLETNQDHLRRNIDAFRATHFTPTPIRLRHSFGTMAYTVSADGAAKLLSSCLPLQDQLIPFPGFEVVIENTSIGAMMNAAYPSLSAYVSIPPLAVSENRRETSEIRSELQQELLQWELAGQKARFWWRDDDAVLDTPELRRLLALVEKIGTVVALAVIPERADDTLAKLVTTASCCIWQHGWRHHRQYEERDCSYSQGEFGEGRSLESMMKEAHDGQIALDRIFGEGGWQRVFVPPFHALSVPFKRLLPSLGYRGLSAGLPLTPAIDTVAEVNAEVDIMNWPEEKPHDPNVISGMLVEQLVSRRQGRASVDTPIGLLTHHLVHDEATWRYLQELFCFLRAQPAVEIVPADRLFSQRAAVQSDLSRGAAECGVDEVTVVITSCGRQDLLEITLDSFLQYNTFPIKELIVIEDGDGTKNDSLIKKYSRYPLRWLATSRRVGQIAAIDRAYREVRTEFIFHCEDDWEFLAPGFIEKSLTVLHENHSVLQVWIQALNDINWCSVLNYTLTAAGVPYRLHCHGNDKGGWGIWHGFTWKPGLRRMRDYRLLGSFESLDPETTGETWEVEANASAFYQKRGFFAAMLADNSGNGYARHVGSDRQIPRDYLPHRRAAVRDRGAQLLMAQLAIHPPFGGLRQHCGRERDPSIDEVPEWQIWTNRATTPDQLVIEEQLENWVTGSSSILHIGVGNSSLGRRFAPRVSTVVGTTLHDEERIISEDLGIKNYTVVCANKYANDMDRIPGHYDFIIDNNPSSFACCLFHFSRMMIAYAELLKRNGGLFLTAQLGWGWVVTDNDPNWSFGWDDWALLGAILRMPVARVTDVVYSMQSLPDSGVASCPE